MSKELCYVIDQISREKGIPREVLIETLRSALLSAVRKKFGGRTNIDLKIDPKTCVISAYEIKRIVTQVTNKDEEISVAEASKFKPDAIEGNIANVPLDLHDFSRIAAQTAKQVIFQRVKEAERDAIYNEFRDKIGQVVSGMVMRKEKGLYFLNLGKTDAILPIKETLPNENLKRGDTVKAYIEDVRITSKGPVIMLSRANPQFVSSLFRMEVPEINDGTVIIKNIVREPGERTKIAVFSKNPSIDPVGACVGMKGTRVQLIVRELRGERIDIIHWTDDPRQLIARALSPATVDRIGINEESKTAMVIVNDQQLSIAIGKKGQNVRLAMKLTGWDIDILSETEYSKMKIEEADKTFTTPSTDGEKSA
ncbi:MAG: transcription termination/antitermination protein NusA [Nitrospirae bacterium]|jgi:N utilization substance protein A|nr:transcription termination/antitermination protein NusA [Nitrospirota bacterium]